MRVINIFDAVRDGTYKQFKKFYTGNPNEVNDYVGMNLLCLALANDINPEEKLKIVKFLIAEGADLNFTDKKYRRNGLHTFYFCVFTPSVEYMREMTKLLVESGIDINCKDKYDAIPLKYAITLTKLPTNELKDIYRYLLDCGSDYQHKDTFGKSCVDYANEYSWRNDVIEIIKEYENENK